MKLMKVSCCFLILTVMFSCPIIALAECSSNATLEEMIFSLPDRFDGSKALNGEVRFKLTTSQTELFYTLIVNDGAASVISGKQDNPILKITCPYEVYRNIELGKITPATAIATGDLLVSDKDLARTFLEHFPLYHEWCAF